MRVKYTDVGLAWATNLMVVAVESLGLNFLPIIRLGTGALFLFTVLFTLYSALTVVLYPDFRLDLRISLTIGLFMGSNILLGIILNATPWGLTRASWMVSFALLATLAAAITLAGRTIKQLTPPLVWGLNLYQVSVLLVGGGLLAAAFLLANLGVEVQPRIGFTQFWMVPTDPNTPQVLNIGIYNAEHSEQVYTVRLTSSGGVILQDWVGIPLRPDEKWEVEYVIPNTGVTYPLSAELYRADTSGVYRRTEYWLRPNR